ncbi:MAG: NAD-dependent epimerase/dehydratase family protein, partial [Patescibacteria group bacterium]
MNILLTGGTGFIGRNLCDGLKDEYKIFTPRHSELEVSDTDAVRKYIIKNKIKVVIHTAVKGGDLVLENILRMY